MQEVYAAKSEIFRMPGEHSAKAADVQIRVIDPCEHCFSQRITAYVTLKYSLSD